MGGYPVSIEEDLDCMNCKANIYFLLDELIRNGVVLFFYADVVVILDCGDFSDGQFKRRWRQRQQKWLFFLKH